MAMSFFALVFHYLLFFLFFRFGLVCDSFSFFSRLVGFGLLGPRRKAMCTEKKGMTMG